MRRNGMVGKAERRHIEALQRRADWLAKRVANSPKQELSYDRAELAALLWVIRQSSGDART